MEERQKPPELIITNGTFSDRIMCVDLYVKALECVPKRYYFFWIYELHNSVV